MVLKQARLRKCVTGATEELRSSINDLDTRVCMLGGRKSKRKTHGQIPGQAKYFPTKVQGSQDKRRSLSYKKITTVYSRADYREHTPVRNWRGEPQGPGASGE